MIDEPVHGRLAVYVNLMKLFEWETPRIPTLPEDPTPLRLLEFLCPSGMPSDLRAFKGRYREVSKRDQALALTVNEEAIVENLFGPLRQAKTSYLIGNYLGAIALCGIVAEKVILVHALHTPGERERDDFERADQAFASMN